MPEARPDVERSLLGFILEELVDERYAGGDPLATEAVDSLGIEQLIEFVEEEFGVRLREEELGEEHFESVEALAALISSRRPEARA